VKREEGEESKSTVKLVTKLEDEGSTTASTSRSGSRSVSRTPIPLDESEDSNPKEERVQGNEEEEEARSPKKKSNKRGGKGKQPSPDSEPQLIGHLPSAEEAVSDPLPPSFEFRCTLSLIGIDLCLDLGCENLHRDSYIDLLQQSARRRSLLRSR
jgi:hypothetical protein